MSIFDNAAKAADEAIDDQKQKQKRQAAKDNDASPVDTSQKNLPDNYSSGS